MHKTGGVKDFFCSEKIRSSLRIFSRLLKKYVMENFIFCAVNGTHEYVIVNINYSRLQRRYCQKSFEDIINALFFRYMKGLDKDVCVQNS